ncbi:hypothetical protein NN561_017148 [Cricetulus griseus]
MAGSKEPFRKPSLHLLPTRRRAGSEPIFPTFVESEDNRHQEQNDGKMSKKLSRSSCPDLYKLLEETLEPKGKKGLSHVLAKTNLYSDIIVKVWQVPKSDSAAVSYTHLDVYKRQEQNDGKMSKKLSRSSCPDLYKLLAETLEPNGKKGLSHVLAKTNLYHDIIVKVWQVPKSDSAVPTTLPPPLRKAGSEPIFPTFVESEDNRPQEQNDGKMSKKLSRSSCPDLYKLLAETLEPNGKKGLSHVLAKTNLYHDIIVKVWQVPKSDSAVPTTLPPPLRKAGSEPIFPTFVESEDNRPQEQNDGKMSKKLSRSSCPDLYKLLAETLEPNGKKGLSHVLAKTNLYHDIIVKVWQVPKSDSAVPTTLPPPLRKAGSEPIFPTFVESEDNRPQEQNDGKMSKKLSRSSCPDLYKLLAETLEPNGKKGLSHVLAKTNLYHDIIVKVWQVPKSDSAVPTTLPPPLRKAGSEPIFPTFVESEDNRPQEQNDGKMSKKLSRSSCPDLYKLLAETLEPNGKKGLSHVLAKTNLYHDIIVKVWQVPKSDSAVPTTLPPPLRKAGSEPIFPTFVESEDNRPQEQNDGKMSKKLSRSSCPDLYKLLAETLEPNGKKGLSHVLAKTNLYSDIIVKVWQVPKSDSAVPTTLPPTLRKAGSEPALATFVESEDNRQQERNDGTKSKRSSRSSCPDLYKMLDISWPWNTAARFSPVLAYNYNKTSENTESTTSTGDRDTSKKYLSYQEDVNS